ncbi:uncharacterized protein [Arachis hypogaea]|uniref:Uncharacterized protein n=1 Tax=Arachis hypogaea TaxID=3818 RepID=A0A445AFF8_ARAHY|nr:hypothetical protein Ahy_B02g058759 [Arachis hypogaea]
MIVTSLADPWMLRFAYGAFLIGRLLIGLICMRWLLLLVIHQMVRVHWLVLTRAVATYITHQFAPGSSSEVLITSADSRIRVVDGVDLVQKFKET